MNKKVDHAIFMQIYEITLDSRDLCSEDRGPDLSCERVFSSERDFSWLFYKFLLYLARAEFCF